MKTLLIWSLLAAAASAQVTVTDTWMISAPELLMTEKYNRVSISVNGSNLDHIQIASNKWVVPMRSGSVKFDAILCGEGYCRPVSWETPEGTTDIALWAIVGAAIVWFIGTLITLVIIRRI